MSSDGQTLREMFGVEHGDTEGEAALLQAFSIAPPPGAPAPQPLDLFDQLMAGTEDDERAVEPSGEAVLTLEDEFRVVASLRGRKKALEDALEGVQKQLTAAEERMRDAMSLQGTRQFSGVEGNGSAYLATEYRVKVADPAAFDAWAEANHPELYSINAQTRASFIRRQYRDKGIAPDSPQFPPGLEVSEVDVLRVRGVRAPTDASEE